MNPNANPFSGFFQGVGNLVSQGVTDVKQAIDPTPPPADGAVVEAAAAQAAHPATKAALHKLAADTYSQMANTNKSAPQTSDPDYQNWLTGAANTVAAPFQQSYAYYKLQSNPQAKAQLDAINNNPDLSDDEKVTQGNALMQKYGGQSPSQSASAISTAENLMPVGGPEAEALAPSTAVGVDTAKTAGKAAVQNARQALGNAADTITQGAQDVVRNASVQPGGFQAGFAKIGPGESVPPEASGTEVQFNKDGTQTVVPQAERTNQSQFAQTEPAAPAPAPQTLPGPQLAGGESPVAQPAAEFNNRESFQQTTPPPNRPAADQQVTLPEATLPGGDPKQIPQRAIDMLDNTYTVPAKKAMGTLQKIQTYRGMLSHVKSGMDPALMEQMPSLVSDSQSGMVPKMIREVGANIKEPIPLKDPGQAAQTIMDQHKIFIDDKAAADIRSDITSALPQSENGSTVDPLDAIQYARELESKAAEIRQGDTYLTSKGDKRYMAQALNSAADDVWDQIGEHVTPGDLAAVKTPERISYLKSLSPRLGTQVENAQTIPQLRSTIRDFVRMGQIVEQTEASSGSVFGKVGRAALGNSRAGQVVKGLGLALKATHNPVGAAADVVKMGAEKAAQMSQDTPRGQLLKALEEESSGPTARFSDGNNPVKGSGKGLKVAGALTAGAGLIGGGMALERAQSPSNAEGNNPAGSSDNSHIGANLSSSFTKSQDGSLQLPTSITSPSGQYMTDAQRMQEQQQYSPNDPRYGQIQQEYEQGQERAKSALPGNSMEFMKNAPQYTAVGNVVQNDIKNLPTGFLNKFKTWSAVQSYASDPNNPYAGELADLDMMNTQFSAAYNQINGVSPGNNQLITAGDSGTQLQAKWTRMMNFIGDTYSQRLEPYQALTATSGAQTASGQPVQGPSVPPPAAPANANSIVGGSPQMAPQFQFQSGQSAFSQ